MKTLYTVKERKIDIPNQSAKINLYLFGDIHRDTNSCDTERWRSFLKDAKADLAENPHTYFIGMGDYNDFASSSEQKAIKNSGKIHETTMQMLDTAVEQANRTLAKEMAFMRGNLIAMVEGNHTWYFENGKSATEDLAERLDSEAVGWLCHYSLKFTIGGSRRYTMHLALCHGKAGGKTYGATINQLADLKALFPIATVYCMGHDHQRYATPVITLIPVDHGDGVKIKELEQFMCRSGSFKKAYEEDTSGYEIGRLLRPANLGAIKLEIKFKRSVDKTGDHLYPEIKSVV